MIKVDHLSKSFGSRKAVDEVSFEVQRGTVLGFLGPNGAGKTTTLRMIAGFLVPDAGTVRIKDIDVATHPVEAQKHIGYMPETTPLYTEMTVEGFLRFLAEVRGFRGARRNAAVEEVLERCFLKTVRRQTIDTLSKGYRQRTCLAQALLHNPDILLLDEPTEGLDPNQKQVVRDMIRAMAKERVVMLSTHVLEEVEAICTRAIIISNGRLVADDSPEVLKKQSECYNRVTLRLEEATEAISPLKTLENVRRVEQEPDGRIAVYPKSGVSIVEDIFELIRARKWKLKDLKVDEGRLEEVFRKITTTEDSQKEVA
jgi:ABC-2 type transport system ATP-binding protein